MIVIFALICYIVIACKYPKLFAHRRALLVLSCVLLALSCSKDAAPEIPMGKMWGEAFKQLMTAYGQGKYFKTAAVSEEEATFEFQAGTSVTVPRSEVRTIDARIFGPPALAVDPVTGQWTINKVKTGIKADKSLSLPDASPLCIWVEEDYLSIAMSNGQTCVIGADPVSSLTSFSILSSDNRSLPESISFEISGSQVTGYRLPSVVNLKFVPRFTFRGVRVTVDGKEQISGETLQDFSKDIVYCVELFDGKVQEYTVSLKAKVDFPTVFVTTTGGAPVLDQEKYVTGSIRIEDPLGEYSSVSSVSEGLRIRGRGNSTWAFFPKKPYRLKLDEKTKVFGMPANKDWVLMACYSDKSLLRDLTAMEISRICGMRWTPAFFPVELYFNGDYQGYYLFGDHKEVAKHRVDIEVVTPQDNDGQAVTGGYYFEIEQAMDEKTCFWTSMHVPMMYKEPEVPTSGQKKYVLEYFDAFEKALQGASSADPQRGYAAYIDVDSFVNYYIIEELVKDIDGNLRKSSFLTKERGKKLEMYHVWDFDLTLGNCNYFPDFGSDNSYKGFYIRDFGYDGYGTGWYFWLFKDPAFRARVKARWKELKPQLDKVPEYIDQEQAYIKDAAERNFVKWKILGQHVWPNVVVTGSYDKEVKYMRDFYTARLAWLDGEISKW